MTSFNELEQKVLSQVEYGEDIRPVRDWLVFLGISAILLFFSLLWNGWLYVQIVSGEAFGGSAVSNTPVDTHVLDTANAIFDKRATEAANYRNTYHFVDPSK